MKIRFRGSVVTGFVAIVVSASFGARAWCDEPQAATQTASVEQSRNGITVAIRKYGFFGKNESRSAFESEYGHAEWVLHNRRQFVVRYEVRRQGEPAKSGGESNSEDDPEARQRALQHRDEATIVHLFAPSGELLTAMGVDVGATQAQRHWVAVDPRWKKVRLEILAPDAATEAGAAPLEFKDELLFTKLPIPRRFDEPVAVDQVLTTKNGLKITLETVEIHSRIDRKGKTNNSVSFHLSWAAPRNFGHPQVLFDLGRDSIMAADGTVQEYSDGGGGGSGGEKGSAGVWAGFLPSPKLKSLSLRVRVRTTLPPPVSTSRYERFVFDLALPEKDAIADVKSDVAPLQSVRGAAVIARVEAPLQLGDKTRTQIRLWLGNDQAEARTSTSTELPFWFIKELKARDESDQKEVKAFGWEGNGRREQNMVAFRTDGALVEPGEQNRLILLEWGDKPRPAALSIEATVEARQVQHLVATWSKVPVPRSGSVRTLDLVRDGRNGMAVVLHRIKRFKNARELPGMDSHRRDSWGDAPGLALVFEVLPAVMDANLPPDTKPSVALWPVYAEDVSGRSLKTGSPLPASGDALEPLPELPSTAKPQKHLWTVLCELPTTDTLKLQIMGKEAVPTGQQETIILRNIAVPVGFD